MRLTDHTDYSLRVLMWLNQTKTLATLSELSEALGISRNNLIKVSNQLVKFGYVDAFRGRSGGIRIKEKTGTVSLREIILRTEENLNIAECFSNKDCDCVFLSRCALKKSLASALRAFLQSLGQTSLDDVTPRA